ncbi:hypothetical protein MMC13_004853 [Lambiella insularis]|nr:hypothetical protein [Lambiella insularis]
MAPPKALLFDIGGVCVVSPMQAIVNYEQENHIPSGWINFAISRSAPNGYWQRLERGEVKLDDSFIKGFDHDLHSAQAWEEFNRRPRDGEKRLKDLANPSQLGDPVSLKAESADSQPTDQDRGAQSPSSDSKSGSTTGNRPSKSLKELAKENPTQLGDPVSLKAETADSEPTDQDRGASSPASKSPDPTSQSPAPPTSSPTLPTISTETLFWSMMNISRTPDPHIYPYLTHLASLHPRPFLLGALSNTVTFPPDHAFNAPESTATALRALFDVFVASAEVGMRKPHREIYELALQKLDGLDRRRGGSGISAGEVLFLDDIGENLRAGRAVGFRTLKVVLGESERAVKELEEMTGVRMGKGRGAKL